MNIVAYYRVSTDGQGKSGLGLEAQREYVRLAAESHNWNIIGEFTDTASGTIPPYAIHEPHLPQDEAVVYRDISGEQFHGSSAS